MLICRFQQIGALTKRADSEKYCFIHRELLRISQELFWMEVCPGSIFLQKVPVSCKYNFT